MPFTIQRGTNISGWLSQSHRRGIERAAFFTADDVRLLAREGFDHVRIPIDEEQMWDERSRPDQEAFSLLDAALDWCEAAGLRAVVDLHILRSHYFISAVDPQLFSDPSEAGRFAGLWQQLSNRLSRRSTDMVAYELLNEAVARNPADWNRVANAAFFAIRRLEPNRTIVLGSNTWNQTHTFDVLDVPEDDHTILTFHYYRPMLLTHYKATWWEGGFWGGPVTYPGQPISDEDLKYLNQRFLDEKVPQWSNEAWNRERIRQDFQLPLQVARAHHMPLYCGEWGAFDTSPYPLREAWFRDMIALFEEYHIAWATWSYKGSFTPIAENGQPTPIIDILLNR